MTINIRARKHEAQNRDGSIDSVRIDIPLLNIANFPSRSDARAVCINGKWFIEATKELAATLANEWEEIK